MSDNADGSSASQTNHTLKARALAVQVWAIFLPQFGLFYRPWLRTLTWVLFVLISVFSLATGFYDLYSHTPYLEPVRTRA